MRNKAGLGLIAVLHLCWSSPIHCFPRFCLIPAAPLNLNQTHPASGYKDFADNKNQTKIVVSKDDCTKRTLSPMLWNQMRMNEYLQEYPHGTELSLKTYADSVGANNFNLRIGSLCRVDQLCNGVSGRDWYALVAAQRWSMRMNQAFDAVAFASTIAMEITQAMTFDFIPSPSHAWEYASTTISAIFWVILAIPGVWFGPIGKYYYRAVLSVFYATTGVIRPISTFEHPTSSHAFTQWSDIAWLLSEVKKNVQGAMVNTTNEVGTSGISTETGLYGLNLDGALFCEAKRGTENDMQKHMDQAYRLQTLSHIWRSQNIFITRGSDPCNGKGANGARTGKGVLSYCTPDGIMMNIVQTKGKKASKKIYGGEQALSKHGFTTEFLTTTAWDCQQKAGKVIQPASWQNATEDTSELLLSDECMFALPVCDLTREDIRNERDSGSGTVVACRKVGGLPI